jgi:predicted phage terminase large subunit-like protein
MDIRDERGLKLIHENPHKKVCRYMQKENTNTLVLLPRRFGKTLLSTMFIIWYCLKYPDRNILLVADVINKACNILNSAKMMMKSNKNLIRIFGKNLLSKKGNDMSKLSLKSRKSSKKEPNVLAYSMLQTPQSLRADLVIFEDVISHNYRMSKRIKSRTDNNFEAILPIMEKSAKLIYIGTRFHHDDLPAQIKREHKLNINNNETYTRWNVIEESAEDEKGNAKFPHIIDNTELQKLKTSLSRSFYASQYLNSPISKEEVLFHMEEYAYYKSMPDRTKLNNVIAGIDLAVSTKSNADNRTIVFIGFSEDKRIYIIDAYSSKEKLNDFYKTIRSMYNKWKPDRVFVEANGAFRIVYDNFVENSINDKSYIPFTDVVNTQNKALRIETTLIPLLKTHTLLLPDRKLYENNESLKYLIETEMTFFNPSIENNSDDLLDALEIACSKAKNISIHTGYNVGGELRTAGLDMRIQ